MSFRQAVISGLYYYATFTGRASRSAFWYFLLFCFLCGLVAGILDSAFFQYHTVAANGSQIIVTPQRFSWIPTIVLFLPNLAITVRRLHDTDHSGWWLGLNMAVCGLIVLTKQPLLILVVLITYSTLIIFLCRRGTQGDNRYGHDPLA